MKKLAVVIFVLVSSFAFSQSTEISGSYDKIGKFVNGVAIVHKNGLVGTINSSGKEIIKPEYEKISAFGKDGVAYTHKNGLVGLINVEGKVIVDNIYESIGHFNAGNAVVRQNGLCGVINKKGKVIVDVKYEKLNIEKGGIVKAINTDGTQVLVKTNN